MGRWPELSNFLRYCIHLPVFRILLGGALGVIFWRVGDLTIRLKSNPLLFSFCKYNFQSAFSDEISETKVLLERAQVTRKVNAVFFFYLMQSLLRASKWNLVRCAFRVNLHHCYHISRSKNLHSTQRKVHQNCSPNLINISPQRVSSRYESRGKLREYQRWQRVAQGVVESNSSFLSALQIINVLLNSMIAQLVSELIVSQHFLRSC